MNWAYAHGDTASSDAGRPRRCSPQDQGALAGEAVTVNRTYGARFLGPLPRGSAIKDCVERRRQFEGEQTDVTIVTPGRPGDRWRAILPLGVLPDDGTTIGARSLCNLMDKLDALYPYGG
jgi:hypothetical protein